MKHLYHIDDEVSLINCFLIQGKAEVRGNQYNGLTPVSWNVSMLMGQDLYKVKIFKTEKEAEELCNKINKWLDQFIYYEENQ